MSDMGKIAQVIAAKKIIIATLKKQKAKDYIAKTDLYLDQQKELLEYAEKSCC